MKYLFPMVLVLFACSRSEKEVNVQYDPDLAKLLQADEYGMRPYVLAFLKEGPNRSQDSVVVDSIQRAHLDNINKMADEGKLVLAGPFTDDGSIKGIYIFAVNTMEEAEKLTRSDPAVQSGRLIMELRPWYGSATLMQVNELHKRVAKIDI